VTDAAAIRVKKLLSKAGSETGMAFRKILLDIASEAAKKALFPGA
jgi:hypothetical protein